MAELDLLDRADNMGAITELARVRASALLREAARLCESFPWDRGAAERFMTHDTFENVMVTNQGLFRVIIRRG